MFRGGHLQGLTLTRMCMVKWWSMAGLGREAKSERGAFYRELTTWHFTWDLITLGILGCSTETNKHTLAL